MSFTTVLPEYNLKFRFLYFFRNSIIISFNYLFLIFLIKNNLLLINLILGLN